MVATPRAGGTTAEAGKERKGLNGTSPVGSAALASSLGGANKVVGSEERMGIAGSLWTCGATPLVSSALSDSEGGCGLIRKGEVELE